MKLQKRKLKYAAIFGLCWGAVLVLLVDGVLGFKRWEGLFGSRSFSYALAEATLWVILLAPTLAVYILTKEQN